jgi:hypothetical protein
MIIYLDTAEKDVSQAFDIISSEGGLNVGKERQEDLDVTGKENLAVRNHLGRVHDVIRFLESIQ